jgi:hypothetical protein
MKRAFYCGWMILFILTLTPAAFSQDNLLLNPGFENGLNDWDDLWGYPSELSDAIYHSGSHSVRKFVGDVSEREYWSQLFQEVDYSPGQPLYASVYAKSTFPAAATARAGLMVQFMNNDNDVIGESIKSQQIGGQTDWRLLEATFAASPSGTTKARLSYYVWAARDDDLSLDGEAYFDDAFLTKEQRPIPPPGGLLNTGFENGLNEWSLYGYPFTVGDERVYEGGLAVYNEIETVGERDYYSYIYQQFPCAPKKKLEAQVYIETDFASRSKAKAGLQIQLFDAKGKLIKTVTKKIGGRIYWRKQKIAISKTPTKTAKVKFMCFVYAPMGNTPSLNSRAYFDAASLTIK